MKTAIDMLRTNKENELTIDEFVIECLRYGQPFEMTHEVVPSYDPDYTYYVVKTTVRGQRHIILCEEHAKLFKLMEQIKADYYDFY